VTEASGLGITAPSGSSDLHSRPGRLPGVGPRHRTDASRKIITTTAGTQRDEEILRGLNNDWIHSDQNGDVVRYEEFLAEDFTAT
jgi:hypothetical protein